MYDTIEIIKTDNENIYLFINKKNILYGGFIIKDIIENLKFSEDRQQTAVYISKKYEEVSELVVLEIIETKIDKILFNEAKRNSLRIITNVKLNFSNKFNFLLSFFNTKIFYGLLLLSFLINSFYFFLYTPELSLDLSEKVIAWVLIILLLFFHEIGHILAARKYKVIVEEIGIGLYTIFPVLFVNLDKIWSLKWEKRVIVNLSGIYVQSIFGILIFTLFLIFKNEIFWYVFTTNFLIIILNLNPFFQFDGYWVLVDLLKINNLSSQSTAFIKKPFKSNASLTIKLYSIAKVSFIIFLIIHLIKKIIYYVS